VALDVAQRSHVPQCRYSPELGRANPERLSLAAEVDRAMAAGEFRLVFQPKISMRDLRVQGVEALVRWHHPERGLVSPAEFLPIIEQTDLIGPLTDRLLDAAIGQWRTWWDGGLDLPVAVNLSARNVTDADLPQRVAEVLARHGAPPEALELELTESAVLNDPELARHNLRELRALGVRLAVDDFGTGYASLAYLTTLPIDTVKIDQSFATPVLTNPRAAAIVSFTVDLARHLELTVVAEGIEDPQTFAALAELGCDVGQGFWMCRPCSGDELTDWLSTTEYGLIHRRQMAR
jgi:EAL domain-containing protein (putative c-di-GMP-specific phosphodiesterase class I)